MKYGHGFRYQTISYRRWDGVCLTPTMITAIFGLALFCVGCLVSVTMAQPDRPLLRQEIRERVNTIMIAKLDEYLDLSVEQADQFFPRFRRYRERLDEFERSRGETLRELRYEEESDGTDENKIEGILDHLEKVDADMLQLHRDFRNEVKPILTPKQRARLVIFSHQFPERVRQLVHDMRHRQEQRPFQRPSPP